LARPVKLPVLLVVTSAAVRGLRVALEDRFEIAALDSVAQARARFATGAYLVVVGDMTLAEFMPDAVIVGETHDEASVTRAIVSRINRVSMACREAARTDEVGAVPYEEFIELARYAATRRYLMSLLSRHEGSVTDAARAASMKRESLHRLLRRHHLLAEDFRRG
jgi:hypothetical protein